MIRHTGYNLGMLENGDTVEVSLTKNAVNVRLMTKDDYYHLYLNDKPCNYYGGVATVSPYTLAIPTKGHWYLVVDMKGLSGVAEFSVSVKQREGSGKCCPHCHNSL